MRISLAHLPGLSQLDMNGPHEVLARLPAAEPVDRRVVID